MSERLPVFVYGTLRPGERNHVPFLAGRVSGVEPAFLYGAVLYEGPGYPYLVRSSDIAPSVQGELVTLDPEVHDEVLESLDLLEGYRPGAPDNHYERLDCEVSRPSADPVRAWVYVAGDRLASRLRSKGRCLPDGCWRDRDNGGGKSRDGDGSRS